MVMLLLIVLSIFFYFVGLKFVVDQDRNIESVHKCDIEPCNFKLEWKLKWRIIRVSAILAIFSFITALLFALSPLVARK